VINYADHVREFMRYNKCAACKNYANTGLPVIGHMCIAIPGGIIFLHLNRCPGYFTPIEDINLINVSKYIELLERRLNDGNL